MCLLSMTLALSPASCFHQVPLYSVGPHNGAPTNPQCINAIQFNSIQFIVLELGACHLCDKFAPLLDLMIFNTLLGRQKLHHETLKSFHSIVYVTQTWLSMVEHV
jgi:hypothetical protein